MKIAPLAQVKDQFSAYVEESQKTPIIITKNGKPVALLSGIHEDDDLDGLWLAQNPHFIKIIQQARERVRRTGGVKSKDFWKTVERRHRPKRK